MKLNDFFICLHNRKRVNGLSERLKSNSLAITATANGKNLGDATFLCKNRMVPFHIIVNVDRKISYLSNDIYGQPHTYLFAKIHAPA